MPSFILSNIPYSSFNIEAVVGSDTTYKVLLLAPLPLGIEEVTESETREDALCFI